MLKAKDYEKVKMKKKISRFPLKYHEALKMRQRSREKVHNPTGFAKRATISPSPNCQFFLKGYASQPTNCNGQIESRRKKRNNLHQRPTKHARTQNPTCTYNDFWLNKRYPSNDERPIPASTMTFDALDSIKINDDNVKSDSIEINYININSGSPATDPWYKIICLILESRHVHL
jgi:hypothetical protein